ncbi:MAG: phosphatidylserine decarboxylase [bacterium]|nr:phosphatidylserine decarboxylase [bacterium]
MSYFLSLFIFAFSLFFLYRFWFLRNPKRTIPAGDNIVSPADGKIVKIIKYDHGKDLEIRENKLGKVLVKTKDVSPRGWLIVIMMNIHNMHRQKAPLDGEILSIKYSKGKFFNAIHKAHNMRASLENENNEILIKTAIGNIKVIQVAGVMAKKIVCAVEEGQKVVKGDALGLIKLGSQVILVLPASTAGEAEDNIELKVKEKDKVKAGSSIIAEIKTIEKGIFDW